MTITELNEKLNKIYEEESFSDKAVLARELTQDAVTFIMEKSGEEIPERVSLLELVESPSIADYIGDKDIINGLHYIRILGMNARHNHRIRKKEAQLASDNVTALISIITSKEYGTVSAYVKPHYISEWETRKLYIDLYLQEAGWEVLETENLAIPGKAGIEIEVTGMPNPKGLGYCDYVLYGKNGKPLAIVEAKKTSVDAGKGRHQADLYAECMKAVWGYKPVIYYTNGYEINVIDGIYPDRKLAAFHSLEDLELMLQRRNRGKIADLNVNKEITGRPYQQIAITNICENFNANRRRGLIVMATGTGKTRVSISLVELLARNGWIKNVLFLADRITLVNQAKRNFNHLLPSMSVCELSAAGEKDMNARLMFSTYQTMINYIDAEEKVFSSGRFDLIIVDEAHRSIFNRYGAIFTYFDSLLVGLTATPKSDVDANTYSIFGCEAGTPNYDYSMEEAVKDHYLVGYNAISRTSHMMTNGIDTSTLTPEELAQLNGYLLKTGTVPTDGIIPANKIFSVLYNKKTCMMVLEELMTKGLRVDGGETIGKTIIFAYNHKHADMIVECFRELYPDYPANTCQLVDYSVKYAEDLVIKFDTDKEFRIAVSVDMLDTGVDIPAVLNLIFFKTVRSKIKFIQMIGRGTRLCENIYGPGKHKSGFYIFDYCGNFEFFNTHSGEDTQQGGITLSQRLFEIKLDILYQLQKLEYQQDSWLKTYYEQLKKELRGSIVTVKSHGSRIQVRQEMSCVDKYCDINTWLSLSEDKVFEIKEHLVPLIDSGISGEYMSVAFDVKMLKVEHDILKNQQITESVNDVKLIIQLAKYLITEKASVPQVLAKAKELLRLSGQELWTYPNTTVPELESLRLAVRDLMPFVDTDGIGTFDIDLDDEIKPGPPIPSPIIDIRTYREKVVDYLAEHSDSKVIKKIYNLEQIDSADLKELERVLWHELGSKEEYSSTTNKENLAVFVRSLTGLNQEAVNEKFGEFLSGNRFNSMQQEFVKTIIDYVRENGDISVDDIINTDPFNNYDITMLFGVDIPSVVGIVNLLHDCVNVPAGKVYAMNQNDSHLQAASPRAGYKTK